MSLVSILRRYFWILSAISYQIHGAFRNHDAMLSIPQNFDAGRCLDMSTVFSTTQPSGLAMCIKTCLLKPRCKAVCFHKLQLKCMLGYNSAAVVTNIDINFITNKIGFLTSTSTRELLLSGDCQTNSCAVVDTCTPLERGGMTCTRKTTDSLPSGYAELGNTGKFIKVYSNDDEYLDAKEQCEVDGAVLARITETIHLSSLSSITSGKRYFIDGSYNSSVGAWLYSDGTTITTSLLSGYLSSASPQKCVIYKDGHLEILYCYKTEHYICEI